MNALVKFTFEEETVRVVMIDGEPWWVAADLCGILSINNSRQALTRLEEDEKGVISNDALYSTNTPRGGAQEMNVVSESGMFALVLGSRKPEAKRFRRWVTGEVLPSIRKTGRYVLYDEPDPPQLPSPAIEDAELPRLTAAIGIMREARQIWGREECRRIWVRIGLPSPIAEAATAGDDLAVAVEHVLRGVDSITMGELAAALGMPMDTRTSLRVGGVLRLLGWANKKERVDGVPKYVWRRIVSPTAGEA